MKIIRNGKGFDVTQNSTIVLNNVTFEQARQYLATHGNKDAQAPLINHSSNSNKLQGLEPEFRGEYELNLRSWK